MTHLSESGTPDALGRLSEQVALAKELGAALLIILLAVALHGYLRANAAF